MKTKYSFLFVAIRSALTAAVVIAPQYLHAFELKDAVELAVQNNPEVRYKWHQFRGATEDIGTGKAGYMPTVDVAYESNRLKYDYPSGSNAPADQSYTTHGWSISLTQNLFQGFQTYFTVQQLNFDQQARYFDFLDTSESIGLQAAQAYIDVSRYRQLVDLAKDNYATHKGIFDQIQQKVQAGVGRRVDLEQAAGRLALAESNLFIQTSNLHDVTARYVRLVGKEPPAELNSVPSSWASKSTEGKNLLRNGIEHSPAYLSTVASIRSAEATVKVSKGAFSPTLNLTATRGPENNYDGYFGQTNKSSIDLVFNINLYRGGGDRARLRSALEKVNAAMDLRDKACRDLSQTLKISYNNVIKLSAQLPVLRQHQLSTEKARDAYRKQFDIGQRSLLDVLDSENELFDSSMSYINAQMDQAAAQATILAGSGHLLDTLRLKPLETLDIKDGLTAEDMSACDTSYTPPTIIDVNTIKAKAYAAVGDPSVLDASAIPVAPVTQGGGPVADKVTTTVSKKSSKRKATASVAPVTTP